METKTLNWEEFEREHGPAYRHVLHDLHVYLKLKKKVAKK